MVDRLGEEKKNIQERIAEEDLVKERVDEEGKLKKEIKDLLIRCL